MPDEIPYDEIKRWFLAQVKKLGVRGFGRKYKLKPSRVSRNRNRILKKKKRMATPFTKRLARIMAAERADELRRQHLAEQAAAVEQARQKREAAAKAEREADRKARKAKDKEEADEARREQELEEDYILFCKGWVEKLRAAGYEVEGPMVGGDADELPLDRIAEVNYIDIGVAAVALLPDEYVIWRDKTVGFFREGVTYTRRLQPTAVPEGRPRPAMIGNVPASTVYYDPIPSERWYYGEQGAKVAAEWRQLTEAYGHLAKGKLPRDVHPETVRGFERLIQIEEQSGYIFEDSRLGPDARDRLKRLQRRATLAAIAKATKNITWRAIKSAAGWCYHTGWKWLLGLIAVLMVVALAVGLVGMVIDVSKWVRARITWVGNWSEQNWEILVLAVMHLFIAGVVIWWVWRKEKDTWSTVTQRALVVVGAIVLILLLIVALVMIDKQMEELGASR